MHVIRPLQTTLHCTLALLLTMACNHSELRQRPATGTQFPVDRSHQNQTPLQQTDIPTGVGVPSSGQQLSTDVHGFFRDQLLSPESAYRQDMDCFPDENGAPLRYQIAPWPPELKRFLAQELQKFPRLDLLQGKFEGIYLIRTDTFASGFMCTNGSTGQPVIFLDWNVAYENRVALGGRGDAWVPHTSALSADERFVGIDEGDQAIATLFHELFHAIDYANYRTADRDLTPFRLSVLQQSWDATSGESRFRKTNIVMLTGKATRKTFCRQDPRLTATAFSLATSSSQQATAELQFMGTQTNFIIPYAHTNFIEDWAATLEVYYMGTRYGAFTKRLVFAQAIDPQARLGNPSYIYDTKQVLKTSPQQLSKMCLIANEVLGENCDQILRSALSR